MQLPAELRDFDNIATVSGRKSFQAPFIGGSSDSGLPDPVLDSLQKLLMVAWIVIRLYCKSHPARPCVLYCTHIDAEVEHSQAWRYR